jgi:hypothetical protein
MEYEVISKLLLAKEVLKQQRLELRAKACELAKHERELDKILTPDVLDEYAQQKKVLDEWK